MSNFMFQIKISILLGFALIFTYAGIANAVTVSQQRACRSLFLQLDARAYKTSSGNFLRVALEQERELTKYYLTTLRSNEKKTFVSQQVTRVTRQDLSLNFEGQSNASLDLLRKKSERHLKDLYYFTSGAGLWSRGGGQVKALIPYNIGNFLNPVQKAGLAAGIDVAKADSPQKVLELSKADRNYNKTEEEQAAELVLAAKVNVEKIVNIARNDPRALTSLDMKFVNVAILSHRANTFIPFDIWTSQQTHKPIFDYIQNFKNTYHQKIFHNNSNINVKIHQYLSNYFKKGEVLGETYIFGYQVGFNGIDPVTGLPVTNTAAIGEGAGMAKTYLDKSGRTAELQNMGKKYLLFDNIEVISEIDLVLGAHLSGQKAVSVLLVPQKNGYSGGSPFLFNKPWGKNLELYEMSALPEEYANGNEYFNSNTMIYSLEQKPVRILGFESKSENGVKFMRVKTNAADITQTQPTAGIGGRIGTDYVNFKSISEFFENGDQLIQTYQNIWADLILGSADKS